MQKHKIISHGLAHALGVLLYTLGVGWIIRHANGWFGKQDTILSVAMFLLLLVFSVAVVGILIFLKPVMMYLDDKKKDAVHLLLATLGWMIVLIVGVGLMLSMRV